MRISQHTKHSHTHTKFVKENWFCAVTKLNIFSTQTSTLKPIDIHGSWLSPLEKFRSNQWINVSREKPPTFDVDFLWWYNQIVVAIVVGMDIISIVFQCLFCSLCTIYFFVCLKTDKKECIYVFSLHETSTVNLCLV